MTPGEANLRFADDLVAALAAAGLRRAVIAPGARSAPLACAFLRRPEIACEVVTDERAAGFFALGLAKAEGLPAAVVTTSGTAAANLLPAVVEASLAGVPMIALTADRPPEAHGWGANQTVDQARLFGVHVRAFHALPLPDAAIDAAFARAMAARLVEESLAPTPGPVHANLPFREPLLPEAIPDPAPLPEPVRILQPEDAFADGAALAARLSGRPGVIVCGELPAMPGFAASLVRLAERLDAPILAGALSNLRFGGHDKRRLRAHPSGGQPDWVLRFGGFPVPRGIERWLAGLSGAEHILVAPPGRWPDPLWRSGTVIRATPPAVVEALLAEPLSPAPDGWHRPEETSEPTEGFDEGAIARALVEALPEGAHCFVGNSLAIRAMDDHGGVSAMTLTLHGNRGASGIDGNLATAAGIAAATEAPTAALIGDQALLHDCGALALLRGRNVVAVVLDNGGGRIFERLPMAQALPGPLLARGWIAPPRLDFGALAAAHGLAFRRAPTRATLAAALREAFAAGGPWLVEASVERGDGLAL